MSRDGTALLLLTLSLALLLIPGASSARKLIPADAPEAVPIEVSGNVYDYFPLSADRALTFHLDGPAEFEAIVRWRFEDSASPIDVEVELTLADRPADIGAAG